MTNIATLIADMVKAGVDPDIIGRTAAALAEREPVRVVDEQAERRRAADRERMRARNAECPPDLWLQLRAQVFARDSYRCVYCGSEDQPLHCDHVIPFSRGGVSALHNLATACATCNISKGARTPEEWLQ